MQLLPCFAFLFLAWASRLAVAVFSLLAEFLLLVLLIILSDLFTRKQGKLLSLTLVTILLIQLRVFWLKTFNASDLRFSFSASLLACISCFGDGLGPSCVPGLWKLSGKELRTTLKDGVLYTILLCLQRWQ